MTDSVCMTVSYPELKLGPPKCFIPLIAVVQQNKVKALAVLDC